MCCYSRGNHLQRVFELQHNDIKKKKTLDLAYEYRRRVSFWVRLLSRRVYLVLGVVVVGHFLRFLAVENAFNPSNEIDRLTYDTDRGRDRFDGK